MRFDPQANFVQADPRYAHREGLTGVSLGSPLKAALVIVVLGLLGAAGIWVWSEGFPGQRKASAGTASTVGSSVVQYAEALISARSSEEAAEAVTGTDMSGDRTLFETRRGNKDRFRQEFEAGKKYMAIGQHSKALPHLIEAVSLNPQYAEARYRLGLAYVHTGNNRAALKEHIALQRLDPDLANLLAHLINE